MKKLRLKIIASLLLLFFSVLGWSQNPVVDSLKNVLKTSMSDTTKVRVLNAMANTLKELDPQATTSYARQASKIAQPIRFYFGLAEAAMNQGNANIILSQYKIALTYFNQAETHYKKQLDRTTTDDQLQKTKNGLARAYASMGVVYSEVNNYSIALHYYFKALKIYQEINNQKSVSKAYNNIAVVYKSENQLEKALVYLKKALSIQQKLHEPTFGVTLMNIGQVYFEQGNVKQAFQYYSKAQKELESNQNDRNHALLQSYWGDYFKKQNDIEKAFVYYQKSLTAYENLQNPFGAALALYNMGELYFELQKHNDALTYAQKSLDLAQSIGVIDQTIHSEKLLSDIYSAMNNPAKSLEHYKGYVAARDSLTNEDNNKKFLRAELNYEFQKREAILLEQNKRQNLFTWFIVIGGLLLIGLVFVTYNRLQIKRRLTLQKEVAEYEQKALHLQMNPHFVFNCLGSISSFIVQNGADLAIMYLSKFSKLMRLTLEYSKGSLIPIDKEIESLQNYLELEQLRFNNKFEFRIGVSPSIEDDMALPPLLIQPFVENAILHGIVPKDGNGNIDVYFNLIDNQLICTVTDDGIGISKSMQMKENSVKAHQSMAMEITKKRLEIIESKTQQKADVRLEEIRNEKNAIAGTRIVISLPVQYLDIKPRT
ncbi:tetratricopeptide repeat protein [Flavobacterium sp. CYK-4]|uniref:tetratricopeptide repeat-containing sensor histidine kinase n=1 Tax=Flavobacterium lotistagni TaxID=2709660 RepID=UPI00140886CF|nr:tetratricopeptide repeat protein [Flavobacterium lotistagni]NHM06255.1 tetratricopeptide repeat protein [Flavobacterium lotistagni]